MQDASKPIWFKKDSGEQSINLGNLKLKYM
jgi:hypothetical protein